MSTFSAHASAITAAQAAAPKTSNGVKVKYGWTSKKYKTLHGNAHIYLNKLGTQVEVSFVSWTINHGNNYNDVQYIGPCYEYVKSIAYVSCIQSKWLVCTKKEGDL